MGEQMRGLIPAFFDNQEQLDNAQNAIAFCTGHDLTRATEAGVTLNSVLGALRDMVTTVDRAKGSPVTFFEGMENCSVTKARAILAHFPNKGTDE